MIRKSVEDLIGKMDMNLSLRKKRAVYFPEAICRNIYPLTCDINS